MNELNDSRYYRRRAEDALDRANRAVRPEIRQIHLEFASRYSDLAVQAADNEIKAPRLRLAR